MTWLILKRAFVNRFFARDFREAKVEQFSNLCQGGISVLGYSLIFTKISKYAPSLVSKPMDDMSHFIMGVFNE